MEPDSTGKDLYGEIGDYYLKTEKLHDVQFIVGEEKEIIKAIRLPLINQSRVWWCMLSGDSPHVKREDILLPDIEPEVFNLLLKHCYGGLLDLSDLAVEVVVKLCYCANKYAMKTLMTKIADRLQPKDVDGVFPALYCLLMYNLQDVEESVRKLVETKILEIFSNIKFLECDVAVITYICQQALHCDEVTLWKEVVRWAKHKAKGDDPAQVRMWMSEPMRHIRLLTLSKEDLCDHVFSTEILEKDEIVQICVKEIPSDSSICQITDSRYDRAQVPTPRCSMSKEPKFSSVFGSRF